MREQRQRLARIVVRSPEDRHHAAVALGQSRTGCCRLRIEPTGVDEHHLVPEHSIDAEDVLHDSEQLEVVDRRAEFLVDLPQDRLTVGLAELDPAADQPVISGRVLCRRRIHADCVGAAIVLRRDQQRLDPDGSPVDRHRERVRQEQADAPWC